jgi:hypothetical protein
VARGRPIGSLACDCSLEISQEIRGLVPQIFVH